MPQITTAGNTVVPAVLALEALGFSLEITTDRDQTLCRATHGDEIYIAEDPVCVLGLVKLIELRGWGWAAADSEIDATIQRYSLG